MFLYSNAVTVSTDPPARGETAFSRMRSEMDRTTDLPRRSASTSEVKISKSSIKILQLNCRSIVAPAKRTELARIAHINNADILCLQETHLVRNDPNPTVEGFKIIGRADRDQPLQHPGGRGGGVIAYQRNGIECNLISCNTVTAGAESVIFSLRTTRGLLKIANVYIPPQLKRKEWYNSLGNDVAIIGDANINGSWYPDRAEQPGLDFETFLETTDRFITNVDNIATRTDPASGVQSGIDIVALPIKWLPYTTWVALESGFSDHHICITSMRIQKRETETPRPKRWNMKTANWEKYQNTVEHILNRRWRSYYSIDRKNTVLVAAIQQGASTAISKSRSRKRSPWWCDRASTVINERAEAWKQYRSDKCEQNRLQLEEKRAQATAEINKLKQETWRELTAELSASDPTHKLWRIVRKLEQRDNPIQNRCPPGGEAWSDEKRARWYLKSELLKRKYKDDTAIDRNAYRCYLTENKLLSIGDSNQTEFFMGQLLAELKAMNPRKSGGPDNVEICFLQQLPPIGLKRLLEIINDSYNHGKVPAKWRLATVVPIPKPGQANTFRPISLTSVIARLAERLVNQIFSKWLEPRLPACQAGFRRNRSTEEQVAALCQDITNGWNIKQKTIAVFCDFSAAYDRVHQHRLLAKLGRMGCPHQLWNWIRAFVMDRRMRCRWNATMSNERVSPRGLPQGATLSPALWLAYIADLRANLQPNNAEEHDEIKVSIFADDLAIWCSSTSLHQCRDRLQQTIEQLQKYTASNYIKLNPSKTIMVPFTHSNWKREINSLQIEAGGEKIPISETARFLGVQLDSKLNFRRHLSEVASRYRNRCRVLRRLTGTKWGCTSTVMNRLRVGFIEPIASYAASVTIPNAPDTAIRLVETARNEAIRIQTGCTRSSPITSMRKLTDLTPLRVLSAQQAALLYEKTHRTQGDTPTPLQYSLQNLSVPRIRKSRSTTKQEAETVLAERGILQLPRAKFKINTTSRYANKATYHYAPCNKEDSPAKQRIAATTLLNNLPPVQCEIWCDGSVGSPADTNTPNRIAVKWDDGWFTGSFQRTTDTIPLCTSSTRFLKKHSHHPDIQISYDDGDIHSYKWNVVNNTITDEDNHELEYHTVQVNTVAAGAFMIYIDGMDQPIQDVIPAGINRCSFTAECVGMHSALKKLHSTLSDRQVGNIRIMTDSKSLIDSLQEVQRRQPSKVQDISCLLANISQSHWLDMVWIPSHCGLDKNEEVDRLAKTGLNHPISQHMSVQVHFEDAKTMLKTKSNASPMLTKVPELLRDKVCFRVAEVALYQLAVLHSPKLHPVRSYISGNMCYCKKLTCSNIKNTVEHFLLRCPARARARRDKLPSWSIRRNRTVREIIEKWPEEILTYIEGEGYFTEDEP